MSSPIHFGTLPNLLVIMAFTEIPVPKSVSYSGTPLAFHAFLSYCGISWFCAFGWHITLFHECVPILSQSCIPTLKREEHPGASRDHCTTLLCLSMALPILCPWRLLHLIYLFKNLPFLRSRLEIWTKSIKCKSVMLTLLQHWMNQIKLPAFMAMFWGDQEKQI